MDNVTYIINWFLENNQFLINRNDKEKMCIIDKDKCVIYS